MDKNSCDKAQDGLPEFKTGILPCNAPLAIPFVPFQRENPPQYSPEEGLSRGTIFPGLDLPWKNTVNKSHPYAGTALGEIMALEFALDDLQLYLDTHKHDSEAKKMFEYYAALAQKARMKYVERCGPLMRDEAVQDNKYRWLDDPWPWEFQERICD